MSSIILHCHHYTYSSSSMPPKSKRGTRSNEETHPLPVVNEAIPKKTRAKRETRSTEETHPLPGVDYGIAKSTRAKRETQSTKEAQPLLGINDAVLKNTRGKRGTRSTEETHPLQGIDEVVTKHASAKRGIRSTEETFPLHSSRSTKSTKASSSRQQPVEPKGSGHPPSDTEEIHPLHMGDTEYDDIPDFQSEERHPKRHVCTHMHICIGLPLNLYRLQWANG